ncbi:sodium-coupled monocarboxylate transporter 2-like [Phlebotomus argentipes]|uniref:sodium-coupled monocarboxylate transporter 2-like n=1 Tax=Phlebotomus argentipes TaxID=94469 RepID=UPI002892D343|nr:sodium-coupled monocarboxylate transporter 2-like [Phlebotomus argentipes]
MLLSEQVRNISGLDYALFTLVLVISVFIGYYHGVQSKTKPNTPDEFFLGNKNMSVFPVAVSLLVTFVSGMQIIGISADVYAHGMQLWLYVFTNFIMVLVTSYIFLPVLYELQLPSSFSYLKLRFGRETQLLASFIYLIGASLFVAINFYVPALVVRHITGTSIWLTTVVLGSVCIFYTAIGGFRAVIWADFFQAILIIVCCLAIAFVGLNLVGGSKEVWSRAQSGGRTVLLNLDPDPTLRISLWTMLFGHTFLTVNNFGLNQTSIQRFLSVSSLAKARRVLILFYAGFLLLHILSIATGLIIYAYYESCDPLTAGFIEKLDQLVPFFVFDTAEHLPGMPGIFVAGIFSASLSTMSSCLNSITTCFFEDFIRPFLPQLSKQKTCNLLKILTVIMGCLQLCLVLIVDKLGTIYTVVITILGLTCGTMLGLFAMGIFLSKANQKGAISGTIVSMLTVGVIIIGGFARVPDPPLPLNTNGCATNSSALINTTQPEHGDLPLIFRISFMYYSTIGFLLVYLIGYPVSVLSGGNKISDQRLLATFLRTEEPHDIEELKSLPTF